MDESQEAELQTPDVKKVLPDVVHSQQFPATVAEDNIAPDLNTHQNAGRGEFDALETEDVSQLESISEHIPSKMEYSSLESDNVSKTNTPLKPLNIEHLEEKVSRDNSLNIPVAQSVLSENTSVHDTSKQSTSWNLDVTSEHRISEESPVNLALSSDLTQESKSHISENSPQLCENVVDESPRSEPFVDSLNDESSHTLPSNDEIQPKSDHEGSLSNSDSEEIIKLDIRGQAAPKLQPVDIFFGRNVVHPNVEPMFHLLPPFLVTAGNIAKIEKDFVADVPESQMSIEQSDKDSLSDKIEQSDLLVEEMIIDETKERDAVKEEISTPKQPKSIPADDTMSMSTLTTEYKTFPDDYQEKLVHLEEAIMQRDQHIEKLTITLQKSDEEKDNLRTENKDLLIKVLDLQHIVDERSQSDHDTIKAQISDYIKYQSMIKDDSTKFYSALMSRGSSLQSSNGEKDMDREEITINYSKSDLKSSGSSEASEAGLHERLTIVFNSFEGSLEENLRSKLCDGLMQVICEEISKIRMDFEKELKDLENQMRLEKQEYTVEARRLGELLTSVKSGSAEIDVLRQELNSKHEKEMEGLRTYFERKCSDMERSYSEDVWRGVVSGAASGATSGAVSGSPDGDAAGDASRRRTRSADPPQSNDVEWALKQSSRKHEQQIEELKLEHLTYVSDLQKRHREEVSSMEEQMIQLKAQLQTVENTEANVPMYQQDIDLELEKRLDDAQNHLVQQLQEQVQVLLSDPDADLSSWPLDLVALRDKIHGDVARAHEKELSSVRDDSVGIGGVEADKWKQRRNQSFDQNRHLEEVTKERDGLKRVAEILQRAVRQLVAYCEAAEDELNTTLFTQLLGVLAPEEGREEDLQLSRSSDLVGVKHVHFAPDLPPELDEVGVLGYLRHQRDLSADLKAELDHSLARLRNEAHDLLQLSTNLPNRHAQQPTEVHIARLVDPMDAERSGCDTCDLLKKNMEEAMSECLQRESLLRSDLDAAMMKIAELMNAADLDHSTEVIAEGYGQQQALSLPTRAPPPRARRASDSSPVSHASNVSLTSPLAHASSSSQRSRDDILQELEDANRKLRSTRQFLEEQQNERELEREDFSKRLQEMRDDNAQLLARLHTNARILREVEQLEAQTREMNQIIADLEARKTSADDALKASEEKVSLLRDIIASHETQLEQKAEHEKQILEQLEEMKRAIEERDDRMRGLLEELESFRSEKAEQSNVTCAKCSLEEDKYAEFMDGVKEQVRWLEERVHRRTQKLELVHEVCSASCSEPSEDVSLREQKRGAGVVTPPPPQLQCVLTPLRDALDSLVRAEDAALKRIADLEMQRTHLKDVAQEVRAERDVLQARMSEQALKISSLSARLETQRNNAEALAHHAASQLSVQLHDALAEVQRLQDELDSKDRHLARLKHTLDEKDKEVGQQLAYGSACKPNEKVLERDLSTAQSRIAQLESLVKSLERDKDELQANLRNHQRALAEKEEQLQELLALKLDEDKEKDEKSELEGGKISARTLSDIVSISEFDEQDLQMRRAEQKSHNLSITGAPYPTDTKDKTPLNRTLPPDLQKHNMSSLNIEYCDHFDLPAYTPRADSLPAHLTSTQNKDAFKHYKRNINETIVFGVDHSGDNKHQIIHDNCSMYPNRDVSADKDISVEPKKIDFSLEPSKDNKTQDEEFTSLRELGITIDIKQENFPDILTQLKHAIKESRAELDNCKSKLKHAEEQLCEFPALKEEVEELKGILENTMVTMETDKKFYENQLENFSSNKKLLEQRVSELSKEVNEKSNDLHLLKEDILRRENMILELAKEKRNLTNKMTELEVRIDELQSRNSALEKFESESHHLREKASELNKLEQLVSEKNHQIDSLNQHLDRLDDLQRRLNDKTDEYNSLKEAFEEKSNELYNLRNTVEALNRDLTNANEENNKLNICNKEFKLKLSKLEKDQENASMKLRNSESELERVNSLNNELSTKIEELKLMTDKLKDKETEIEILNEDMKLFHEEIASLKEQLKIVSRSPSPRKNGEKKTPERLTGGDTKQLVKIRKQVSLLQHELDLNRKELNDKAFDLAKAKLNVTELKNELNQKAKLASDKDLANVELRQQTDALQAELQILAAEKQQLADNLQHLMARMREESNIEELKAKLQEKTARCQDLEQELQEMRDLMNGQGTEGALVVSGGSGGSGAGRARSPTLELERALRDQLNYSHRLDDDIMEQILSASSDEQDVPRLALHSCSSPGSAHSSSSERLGRLRAENERLAMQTDSLQARLRDKDALIAELNSIRDKLVQDYQTAKLRYEAEKQNSGRLQLLLDTHKETAESLQSQDSNMIQILKKRLESAMASESEMRARMTAVVPLSPRDGDERLRQQVDANERLRSEVASLRVAVERARDAASAAEQIRTQLQRELDARADLCHALKTQLAEHKRQKQESNIELARSKQLVNTQSTTIKQLEKKLKSVSDLAQTNIAGTRISGALNEIEGFKSELVQGISTLRRLVAEGGKGGGTTPGPAIAPPPQRDDKEQAIRYLQGRCLRLESCRKALVWQKRYLQRVISGYTELEKNLRLPSSRLVAKSTGKKRFKCVATLVVIVVRMGYLVRKRLHARALSAACILRPQDHTTPVTSHSPASLDSFPSRRQLRLDVSASPALHAIHTLHARHNPLAGGDRTVRPSPFYANSSRDEPFMLNSPRGELGQLELIGGCLRQATEGARNAP